ncbi:type VI secretion system tip protein VgrG [Oxalobacteraceae bacterium]|nr:type VI secretion system tip protein VgrG [Oxalobacteraceae bacterium]
MDGNGTFFDLLKQVRELTAFSRPLRLRLDLPSGQSDSLLLPQRVVGTETICGGIEYRVLCVSEEVELPLKQMIAVAATLEFVTDIGELRSVCGIVTEASSGDSDGGLASYQLVLRDALTIMEKRINTRVFRNMNEVGIVYQILNEWQLGNPLLGICFTYEVDQAFGQCTYPQREFTMQHNESDADFIRRLLKRRGIGWYIRATPRGSYSFHTLVLFNYPGSLLQNAAGEIRYHRDAATEERDTITAWRAVRSLQPGKVTRHSWNYMNPAGTQFMGAQTRSNTNQGASGNQLAASLDDYQILMPHAGIDNEDLLNLGKLHVNRHDYESKCFHGEGSVRDLCAGEYFTLSGHPEIDTHPREERDFVVTALTVTAQNNLSKALAARVEGLFSRSSWMGDAQPRTDVAAQLANGPMRMHVQFTAVRRGIDIVPAWDARIDLPQVGMQSAMVVGPKGQEVHCDDLGRVKIRFPGTREQDHEHAHGAGASDGEYDSAWVRVASNWAGNGPGNVGQCGTVGLPRIGSEVLIAFLGGDPDKPVIVGQLYNSMAPPPALSNLGNLPGNCYLSGIKSREVRGSRANQLRFDDTSGRINAQLASDHGQTQLNLGFLTQPLFDGESEARGEGAELRSDHAVSIRGAKGVLLSASKDTNASEPLLSREGLAGTAELGQQVARQLSSLAEKLAEDAPDGPELANLGDKIKDWDGNGEPIVALSAQAGAFIGSQQAVAICAQSSIDLVSAGDTRVGTGANLLLRAARGVSLFAFKLGIKLIAASGAIRIQAQSGDIEITTTKRIKLIATEGIELQSDAIKIVAKDCQADYGGGAITQQSSGAHTIKSSRFNHENGGAGSPENLDLPTTEVDHDQRVEVSDLRSNEPIPNRRYRITSEDGRVFEGTTDEDGLTEKISTKLAFGHYEIELLD